MKTQKLIPLLDYVLEQEEINGGFGQEEIDKVWNYAKFLSQPLKLSQFVPCDSNDVPLDQFIHIIDGEMSGDWNKAKSNVLFEGFEIETDMHYQTKREIIWMPNKIDQVWRRLTYHTGKVEIFFFTYYEDFSNIESIIKADLTLTENAVKLINK